MNPPRHPYASFCAFCLMVFLTSGSVAQPVVSAHPTNPVLANGPPGSWDAGIAFLPEVVEADGTYTLYYTASADLMTTTLSIGTATSTDGLTWTKNPANPTFTADGDGFDAFAVAEARLAVDGEGLWTLYYNGRAGPGPGPGPAIGRAFASGPEGPWTREADPFLTVGGAGEWDGGFVTPSAVVYLDGTTTIRLYYSGGDVYPFPPDGRGRLGMATSTDGGHTWTKYDDPATTDPPFAESDPVLDVGLPGSYDSGLAWEADVLPLDGGGWEMFYSCDADAWTGEHLCYATSPDGIAWTKADDANPFFRVTDEGEWATLDLVLGSVLRIDGRHYLYYMGNTTLFDGQIGVAVENTGTPMGDGPVHGEPSVRAYPNPTRGSLTVSYTVSHPGPVRLSVVDHLGRVVHRARQLGVAPGEQTWRWPGTDARGRTVASGLYFVRVMTEHGVRTASVTVLR